jgi:hypothetical protein
MRRAAGALAVLALLVLGTLWMNSSSGASTRPPRTFHVGYGETALTGAQPGDKVLCPRNGGAGVPAAGSGVFGTATLASGFTGTIGWSVRSLSSGGAVVTCRRG